MGIAQTRYSVKFRTLYKIVSLKYLWKSVRDFKICQQKEISMTFKHLNSKSIVFQGFQGLEKAVMKFKHFQALQGPV